MKNWVLYLFLVLWVTALPAIVWKPSEDEFYTEPKGFESAKPGDILRSRKTPYPVRSIGVELNIKNSWQLLVRSTNQVGKPSVIVATVLEPYNADKNKVVSYQVAEDAASGDCAPSYSLYKGASFNTLIAQLESIFFNLALQKGYFVVLPDYEGLDAQFTAAHQAGQATLDAVRAALNSEKITGIDKGAKLALWGYSGGSIAAGWGAALQPTYAPDLNSSLVGAAMGGVVTNLTSAVLELDNSIFAGLGASGLVGLAKVHPEIRIALEHIFDERILKRLDFAAKNCMLPTLLEFAQVSFFTGNESWSKTGDDIFNDPNVKPVLDYNTLALNKLSAMPEIPMMVYHGALDEVIPFLSAQRIYENWSEWGIKSLEFNVDLSAEHILGMVSGAPMAISWIEKRFNGEPPVKGSVKTSRLSNALYPNMDSSLWTMVKEAASAFFGQEVGPTTNVNTTKLFQRAQMAPSF